MKLARTTLLLLIALALWIPLAAATDDAAKPPSPAAANGASKTSAPAAVNGTSDASARAAVDKTLSRIAVIGASMSNGFGVRLAATLDDGKKASEGVGLAALVKAAAKDPSILVLDYATSLYFMNPAGTARSSVARALAAEPTCVLALDWIFWNGYGVTSVDRKFLSKDEERLALLENALQCLQPLCDKNIPIVLGDFPDMHSAIGGGMISAPMVPSVECLAALNKRLAEWARDKPNVCMIPLSRLTEDLAAKKPIKAGGRDWSAETLGPLLQKDRLHPTFVGTVSVFAAALDALDAKADHAALKSFELDPAVLRERFVKKIRDGAGKADAGAEPSGAATTGSRVPAAASSGSDPSPSAPPAAAPTGSSPRW